MTKPHTRFIVILAVAYGAALLLIAFWPTPVDTSMGPALARTIDWFHARGLSESIGYKQIEFSANIALFVPFGYLTGAWVRRWWAVVAIGFAASCLIEFGQGLLLSERYSSMWDIVANTLGATLGAGLFLLVHRKSQRAGYSAGSR
ncbi:VanZ family protein [Paeniglutamicibacter antarcticus]|uniref:VanZ-like domain-containing protein n=1 Tax=Paeniglutamicibacter antarcticus TaxID=494023 RepID=A0ABP9TSV0_9MICC